MVKKTWPGAAGGCAKKGDASQLLSEADSERFKGKMSQTQEKWEVRYAKQDKVEANDLKDF